MDRETISIGQCLHGYENGHSLLASSVELDSDARRLLLLMSDMSGPQVLSGFEEYLTGYPIKELGSYAIAKTWYAQEMQRPGCVWTQTLLVSFSDLPRINQNISTALLSLFERPILNLGFSWYEQSRYLDVPYDDYNSTDVIDNPFFIKPLLFDLYSSAKPIVIPSESPKQWESILLKIWLQQWPRLQRNFSFCTGSLTLRNIRGNLLDLQVIPSLLKLQESQRSSVVYESNVISTDREPAWLNTVYLDLNVPSDLQSFFRKYGTDVRVSRLSLQTLTSTYLYFFHNYTSPDVKQIVQYLSTTFPKNDEANILKASILGEVPEAEFASNFQLDESEILSLLATTPLYNSFDYSKLNFQERFTNQLSTNPLTAFYSINEMISLDLNPHGEAIIKHFAFQAINYSNFLYSDSKFNHLLIVFAQSNPEFCYHPEFWRQNLNNIGEIVKAVSTSDINWQKVIDILIVLPVSIESNFFDFAPAKIANFILTSINDNSVKPNYSWTQFLQDNSSACLQWINEAGILTAFAIEILMDVLNPNSDTSKSHGFEPSIKLLDSLPVATNRNLKIRVCSFTLALAFNLREAHSQTCIQRSFEEVYNAAHDDQLDYKSWRYLESHTEPLAWWNDWDQCRKLVKALAKFIADNFWDLTFLHTSIQNEQLLSRIDRHVNKYK